MTRYRATPTLLCKAHDRGLEEAHQTIAPLRDVGRQLVDSLDPDTIFTTLYRQVKLLMPVDTFAIGTYARADESIDFTFAIRNGERIASFCSPLDDAHDLAAWCARTGEELIIDELVRDGAHIADSAVMPAAGDVTRSGLYVPLSLKGRVVGVMTVQSNVCSAYDAMQMAALVNLAPYVAVALSNADADQQVPHATVALKSAPQQTIFRAKSATIANHPASAAHEFRHPASFAHAGAQALGMEFDRFRQFLLRLAGDGANSAVLESINQRLDRLNGQMGTIVDGTSWIGGLINDIAFSDHVPERAA